MVSESLSVRRKRKSPYDRQAIASSLSQNSYAPQRGALALPRWLDILSAALSMGIRHVYQHMVSDVVPGIVDADEKQH